MDADKTTELIIELMAPTIGEYVKEMRTANAVLAARVRQLEFAVAQLRGFDQRRRARELEAENDAS
jgi:hypothetical protein